MLSIYIPAGRERLGSPDSRELKSCGQPVAFCLLLSETCPKATQGPQAGLGTLTWMLLDTTKTRKGSESPRPHPWSSKGLRCSSKGSRAGAAGLKGSRGVGRKGFKGFCSAPRGRGAGSQCPRLVQPCWDALAGSGTG